MGKTSIDYYNKNAKAFLADTAGADMHTLQDRFLTYIPAGGRILDLGCGSGRDSKAFLDAGYEVTAVDGSEEMCRATEELTGLPVICSTFEDYQPTKGYYDGIWASASLLHLRKAELPGIFAKLAASLKEGGCFYASFKYGNFEGERNGRFYTDLNEKQLDTILAEVPGLEISFLGLTDDVRPGRENEKWLNVCLKYNPA